MANFYNKAALDGCMDWEDTIESDGQEFITLPEGDYLFEVVNFERGRYPGSAKIPACNKAELTLEVKTDNGTARVRLDLILYRNLEWKIAAFFRCIGQKQKGERLVMNWNSVVGTRGRAHFKPRTYTGKDGNEHTANDCDRFYDYDEEKMPAMAKDAFKPLDTIEDDDELPFF